MIGTANPARTGAECTKCRSRVFRAASGAHGRARTSCSERSLWSWGQWYSAGIMDQKPLSIADFVADPDAALLRVRGQGAVVPIGESEEDVQDMFVHGCLQVASNRFCALSARRGCAIPKNR